jgi:hypothetical protein
MPVISVIYQVNLGGLLLKASAGPWDQFPELPKKTNQTKKLQLAPLKLQVLPLFLYWPWDSGRAGLHNKLLGNEVCNPLLLSASPRCVISGMASGSIVLFYNDFNRWHHEYQTRYWWWRLQLGPAVGWAGKDPAIILIEITVTSECNLNSLQQAKYFLKFNCYFCRFCLTFGGE